MPTMPLDFLSSMPLDVLSSIPFDLRINVHPDYLGLCLT
jgi:hypothetical protein